MQEAIKISAEVYQRWQEDKVSRLAAALAYFTVFSLPPILILVIAISGSVFGREAASGEIVREMRGLLGEDGAKAIQDLIKNANQADSGHLATVISLVTLFIGASGLFIALQDALNTIWGVVPKPGLGIMEIVRHRILSFTLVVGLGFLLLVSLAVSAALAGFTGWLNQRFPDGGVSLKFLNIVISFGITTLLFAAMFKVLPDVKIPWRGVMVGAVLTSVMFNGGKFLIGLYLGNSSTTSVYGAAGSLVVMLIWAYYSAQIFLTGAVFTRVYASRNVRLEPDEQAVPITKEARAREGIPKQEAVAVAQAISEKKKPRSRRAPRQTPKN